MTQFYVLGFVGQCNWIWPQVDQSHSIWPSLVLFFTLWSIRFFFCKGGLSDGSLFIFIFDPAIICSAYLYRDKAWLEPILADIVQGWGYSLQPGQVNSPSQGWHIETNDHSHSSFTPMGNLESPINLSLCTMRGRLSTVSGENPHSHRENMEAPHEKGLSQSFILDIICNFCRRAQK